jgi:DNA-directed RNA polymerase specialized sigma24 family protein
MKYLSNNELIEALKQTDSSIKERAENQLFKARSPFVKYGIKHYRLSEDEALECYSESCLKLFDQVRNENFLGHSSLKTYHFQIFSNKCVDCNRKKSSNKYKRQIPAAIPEILEKLSDQTKSIIQHLIDKMDLDLLKARISQLSGNCAELLNFFLDGVADKDILARVDHYKSVDVIRVTRNRCIESLRQLYHHKENSNG